jgi:hypothetical protein
MGLLIVTDYMTKTLIHSFQLELSMGSELQQSQTNIAPLIEENEQPLLPRLIQ